MSKIVIAGYLNKVMWGGQIQPREQDFVVHPNGLCMSVPATYTRHPFNILEIVYEDDLQGADNSAL